MIHRVGVLVLQQHGQFDVGCRFDMTLQVLDYRDGSR